MTQSRSSSFSRLLQRHSQSSGLLVGLILSLLAAASVFYSTQAGIGLEFDSRKYLVSARQAVDSGWLQGVDKTGHFPPLYPWIIVAMGKLAGSFHAGARVLNLLSAALLVFFLHHICRTALKDTEHPLWTQAVVSLGLLGLILSDDLVRLSSFMLSELVFMAMVAACLLALQRAQENSAGKYYCLGGLIIGLAALTRHAGLFFLVPTLCWAWLSSKATGRTRLTHSAIYLLSAALPIIASKIILAPTGHRTLLLHWPGSGHWNSLGVAFASWLLPYRFALPLLGWLVAMGCLLFCGKLMIGRLRHATSPETIKKSPVEEMLALLAFASAGYLGLLFVTVSVVYYNTPFDYRLLFPAHVLLLLMAILRLASMRFTSQRARAICFVCLLVWFGGQGVRGAKTSHLISQQGIGITSQPFRSSTALQHLRNLPLTIELVSNKPGMIEELLGRPCSQFPRRNDEYTMQLRLEQKQEMEILKTNVAASKAIIVWFLEPPRPFMPAQKDFEQSLELRRLDASDEKAVLYTGASAPPLPGL
jgi:4-amino-4-deoxy-L-arabinose transferase-like glycosyltransferase